MTDEEFELVQRARRAIDEEADRSWWPRRFHRLHAAARLLDDAIDVLPPLEREPFELPVEPRRSQVLALAGALCEGPDGQDWFDAQRLAVERLEQMEDEGWTVCRVQALPGWAGVRVEEVKDPEWIPAPPERSECPDCHGRPKRSKTRTEGGAYSCAFCNRTLTFNFMRDGTDRQCSCDRARRDACPTCLGERTVPAPPAEWDAP